MTFTKFVQIGRVMQINYGKNEGKLVVVLDILNENRVLIEGPESGIPRQIIPIRRLSLTKFRLPITRNQSTGILKLLFFKRKRKVIAKTDLNKKWSETVKAKVLAAKEKRSNLNDFQRFQAMVLKKRFKYSKILSRQIKTLKKSGKKDKKPVDKGKKKK